MAYQPKNFNFTEDKATGFRLYEDDNVQHVYLNLRIFSQAVHDIQMNANTDLLFIQNNVQVAAVQNQTVQTICMFACKLLEGATVFFTPATGPAIAAFFIGRIASGIITAETAKSKPTDDIQKEANEVRSGMNAMLNLLKHRIDEMIVDIEGHWNTVYHCDGYLDPLYSGDVTLADLADHNALLPDDKSPQYDDFILYMGARCRAIITQKLLPAKWMKETWSTYDIKEYYLYHDGTEKRYDFDYLQYNPHTDDEFWAQEFQALPIGGSKYIFGSSDPVEGHVGFLRELALDPRNDYNKKWYSSYGNWIERYQQFDGEGNRWYHAKIHNAVLVDSNGDYAPSSLSEWLFIDRIGPDDNPDGIATREEVYRNWFN
jgi:hypothetical protein